MSETVKKENPKSKEELAAILCTHGLLEEKITPTLKHFEVQLKEVAEKQVDLIDRIGAENEKFVKSHEQFRVNNMIETTQFYHDKLINLRKEMNNLSERSVSIKNRALKLQEAKQKEALKREQKRQKDLEYEEQLTAKPSQQ